MNKGKIVQIIGPVIDAEFATQLPAIYNAQQIIKDVTLEYNKLRQANITKELLEITTAQMAMG